MPELPEAETIARGLVEGVRGRSVRRVEVIRPDVVDGSAQGFAEAIQGSRISEIGRRGKNLVLTLVGTSAPGSDTKHLVINLGMSGRLLLGTSVGSEPLATHPAVTFQLDDGSVLIYHDIRRFGRLSVFTNEGYSSWSDRLGPEPLSDQFDAETLSASLRRSRAPIRSWLLDQSKVAGVGNIYANEALWHARIHPRTPAGEIPLAGAGRLHESLRTVLSNAIAAGGTTLRDYRTADGWPGSYAGSLRVYGNAELPCSRCGRPIVREILAGRSAFFCPECQPPPGD